MARLKLPAELDDRSYERLANVWNGNQNVSIELPSRLSEPQLRRLSNELMKRIPDEFALAALANLVDLREMPPDLLETLFEMGDTGINVSICLRGDLSERLKALCESSIDPHVREHWQRRK